jgi:biofilm PGA synthesis N-glycosyltransferase PgaC
MTVSATSILYWFLLFIVFYTYFGYGILVWLFLKLRDMFKKNTPPSLSNFQLPKVAFIIPAYNEGEIIAQKLKNSTSFDYPPELLKIIVVADGSGDKTADVVKNFPGIIFLQEPVRKGKAAAMNHAVESSGDSEILVFSDANTSVNSDALKKMVSLYAYPQVGGVSGEKKVLSLEGGEGKGESAYWKYESALKQLDSRLHSVAGAAGELLSVRKSLYEPIEESIILDDFVLSFRVCMKGYSVKYEPEAVATENPSLDLKEEKKRKLRISAGAFQAMQKLLPLLNIFKYGTVSFQYISRRVFRWVVCPLALPLIFILNVILVAQHSEPLTLYKLLLILQVAFYLISLVGGILAGVGRKVGVFYIAFYFVFMNFSVFGGFARYLTGGQSANWDKAARAGEKNYKSLSKNT